MLRKYGIAKDKSAEMTAQFLNYPMNAITRGDKEGELYGLELELEGRNVRIEGKAVKGWRQTEDGSLRAVNGEAVEYVFSSPCPYKEALERVDRLFRTFEKCGTVINNSYRCSTHVHVNFSDRKVRDVINFFCLFTIMEEILEAYSGEGREGNLFSLPTRDAEEIVNILLNSVSKYQNFNDFNENIRYCALNLSALNKFGSIEIRTMRGADNDQMVKDWIEIIHQMYDFTVNRVKRPVELIENLSFMGVDGWMLNIFTKEVYDKLRASWPPERNLHQSLYEGVRLIQFLAYRLDEAFQIEVPDMVEINTKSATKKGKPRRQDDGMPARITRNGRELFVPRNFDFVDETRIDGILPQIIYYDRRRDQWREIIDENGHGLAVPRIWNWVDRPEHPRAPEIIDEIEREMEEIERDRDEEEW